MDPRPDDVDQTIHLASRLTRERLATLRRWAQDPADPERRAQAREAAHKLSGSLGMFGAPAGSEAAAQLEAALEGVGGGPDPVTAVDELEQLARPVLDAVTPADG